MKQEKWRYLLWPLARVFSVGVAVKNRLYDQGAMASQKMPIPVVSIGNLTMGGTGKTPIISSLVKWSIGQGLRPAIVLRGYGGDVHSVNEVIDPNDPLASKKYGDEAVMLKRMHSSVPVMVGAKRTEVIDQLLKQHDVQLVFADDAFQHRQLGRDVDVVVVDCMEPSFNYNLIPMGRGREPVTSIARAQFVILTKCNLVEPEVKKSRVEWLEQVNENIDLIEAESYITGFLDMNGSVKSLEKREKVLLVSAVGNPKSVERLMEMHAQVTGHIVFRDHHDFTAEDVSRIEKERTRLGVRYVIVTQKDAVKLQKYDQLKNNILVSVLEPKLSLKVKKLHESISKLVR